LLNNKQVALVPAHMMIVVTGQKIGTPETTFFGMLLENGTMINRQNRLRVAIDFISGIFIPKGEVDSVVFAFENLADKLECRGANWFKTYMYLIAMQKSSPEIALGKLSLRSFHDMAPMFVNKIAKEIDTHPGTLSSKILVASSMTALTNIPDGHQSSAITPCYELLSVLINEGLLTEFEEISGEIQMMHDTLRIRLNPGCEEGTVKTVGKQSFVVLTAPNTAANDDGTTKSSGLPFVPNKNVPAGDSSAVLQV